MLPIPITLFSFVLFGFYAFPHALINYGIFPSTLIAGLVLYVVGRKEFAGYVKDRQIVSGLVTLLGFVLIIGSVISFLTFVMFTGMTFGSSGVRPPPTLKNIAVGFLAFVWCGLVFVSGFLVLDGGKMREDEASKTIDFEEVWKKYPKDLFAKYVKQYPHNPTGVLKWHINKRMKKGITRDQAIEELTKESGSSRLS